jgi:anti-sigma factor RsiW
MMNCARCRRLLLAHLEGVLEGSEKQAVEEHLNACGICRTEQQDLAAVQQDLLGDGATPAWTNLEEGVMNRIIREQNVRLKSARPSGAGLPVRKWLRRGATVKIAVAAAVVLAASGGIFLWTGTKSGAVLAHVLAKVEQVQAFMYRMESHTKITVLGTAPIELQMKASVLVAAGCGMRMDASMSDPTTGQMVEHQFYVLPEQEMAVTLIPAKKQYERVRLDESLFQAKRQESDDPRLMIRRMLTCPYKDLGQSVLEGVEVQGFQTADPFFTGGFSRGEATLWVAVKTGLPVRMDVTVRLNEQSETQTTLYDFQWHVPVSETQFDPVIPADFTPGVADRTTAEHGAVEGLRLCVQFLGQYPESLDPTDLLAAFLNLGASPTPAAKELAEEIARTGFQGETARKTMETMKPLQALIMFYTSLAQQGLDPVYYGKSVRPGDAGLVLLRWKVAENEYRVIFGDLHAVTVEAEALAKLETAGPK